MGFGLLFFGYIFLLKLSTGSSGFDYLPDIVGYCFMFAGLLKLGVYNKGFKYAKVSLIPLTLLSGFQLIYQIYDLANIEIVGAFETVSGYVNIAVQVLMFIYHTFLFLGIREIANETELPKIAYKAGRNFAVTVVYYLAVAFLGLVDFGIDKGVFALLMYLFGIIWLIMNLVLIFSCYMRICLEGDEDMPVKPSRFSFINRMNERLDNAIKKSENAGKEYGLQKYEKKKNKKKRK